jgi:GAF domain-containing protein
VLVPDLGTEERWRAYSPAALDAGVRASLSVPLDVDGNAAGALNIYARRPAAFDAELVDAAFGLAHYTGIVATATDERNRALTLAEQLQPAMESRAVIEQAKGILMAQQRCGPDEAFAKLVRLSQDSHRKLREIAQMLVAQVAAQE